MVDSQGDVRCLGGLPFGRYDAKHNAMALTPGFRKVRRSTTLERLSTRSLFSQLNPVSQSQIDLHRGRKMARDLKEQVAPSG